MPQAMAQYIRKAQDHWRIKTALTKTDHDFVQRNTTQTALLWVHKQVATTAHTEVAFAPTFYLVEAGGI
jgi:hypothetical protein